MEKRLYCPHNCGLEEHIKQNRPVVSFDDSKENPYSCEFRECVVVDQLNLSYEVNKGLEKASKEEK